MRVLQVAHALPPATYGGTELYTRDLARALAEQGQEVGVAAPRGAGSEVLRGEDGGAETRGVETFDLPDPGGETAPAVGERPLSSVTRSGIEDRFADVLGAFDPDVVHFQHFKHLSATLPQLCALRETPCVATLHDFWTVCHREQLYRPEGQLCSGPESVSKCAECYRRAAAGDADGERATDGGSAVGTVEARTEVIRRNRRLRQALDATDRLVAPSSFLRERFAAFGVPSEKIDRLRNGIEVERFEDTGFDPDEPFRVGYAGRITERKGVHLLVEAVEEVVPDEGTATGNQMTETELHVFGAFDPDSDEYHARLAASAGDRTTFRGWYEDRSEPYREVDVLVLPSIWYENSPLVIQEAFASGVPVVTADLGGMAELVSDGEDGLTFPVGDADALAARLRRLANEPSLVAELRAGVEEPTRLTDHAAEIADLYGGVRR